VALAHTQTGDALQAFRESEEKYRFLTETVPVQIWTAGPDGRLDYVSHQTAAYFGLAPAQILADGWQNVVHADDLPRVIERWTHALQTGEDYEVEFRLRSAAGAYLWHLGRAVAQRSIEGTVVRWFGTNTNIEEQREHQRHVESLLRVLPRSGGRRDSYPGNPSDRRVASVCGGDHATSRRGLLPHLDD
jgi:PAS domain S-box-containing protein